jgi:DNA-binding Lrp family transcriptional regulator
MAHVLSGRAETPTQSKILTYVRDEGPLSRMDLAARLRVSRTTVAAEVGRLVELGLAEDGGPAVSRGGRRSNLVDLDAGLRFVGIELGATSMRIAVTDGRLGVLARASAPRADIRRGPEPVLAEAIATTRKLLAEQGVERPAGVGIGVPGPVDFQAGIPVSPPMPQPIPVPIFTNRKADAERATPVCCSPNAITLTSLSSSTPAWPVRRPPSCS